MLDFYDADKQYPVFGFGGQARGQPTSHCFPLNGNPGNPYVPGLPAVMATYRQGLMTYGLSGPTLFAPLIRAVSSMAAQPATPPRYFVLLIMTDGCIMDMPVSLSLSCS